MLEHIKLFGKTHIFYIILIVIGLVAFRSWLAEHDARVQAESTVKQANAHVKDIEQQAAQKVQIVTKIVHDAKTPAQQIAAVPQLTDAPLNVRPVAGLPDGVVAVDLAPLVAELGQCKTDSINLAACTEIVKTREAEIVVLKKKPSFWERIKSHGKSGVLFIVVFEAVKIALTKQI